MYLHNIANNLYIYATIITTHKQAATLLAKFRILKEHMKNYLTIIHAIKNNLNLQNVNLT